MYVYGELNKEIMKNEKKSTNMCMNKNFFEDSKNVLKNLIQEGFASHFVTDYIVNCVLIFF